MDKRYEKKRAKIAQYIPLPIRKLKDRTKKAVPVLKEYNAYGCNTLSVESYFKRVNGKLVEIHNKYHIGNISFHNPSKQVIN